MLTKTCSKASESEQEEADGYRFRNRSRLFRANIGKCQVGDLTCYRSDITKLRSRCERCGIIHQKIKGPAAESIRIGEMLSRIVEVDGEQTAASNVVRIAAPVDRPKYIGSKE